LRDEVKIIVGGAPVTQAFAEKIGADGFAPDASSATRKAKELLA
ncbi:MAG: cobalamin-binding protein, partial [Anaerolineae bacterium]